MEKQLEFNFGEVTQLPMTQCANDRCNATFAQVDRYPMFGDDYCSRTCALADNLDRVEVK